MSNPKTHSITVTVPLAIRRRGGRKLVVAPNGQDAVAPSHPPDTSFVKAFARAWRWQSMLEEGRYATITDLAAAERISPSYVARLLRLTLLVPEVVEQMFETTD